MKLIIEGELTDLNSYMKAERTNRFMAANIKHKETQYVYLSAYQQKIRPIPTPVIITYHFYCKNKRKDKDNIMFAQKFILDGIVWAGVIPDDSWDFVDIGKPTFHVDAKHPRIEVDIDPL